jgi:hypothetical protein
VALKNIECYDRIPNGGKDRCIVGVGSYDGVIGLRNVRRENIVKVRIEIAFLGNSCYDWKD